MPVAALPFILSLILFVSEGGVNAILDTILKNTPTIITALGTFWALRRGQLRNRQDNRKQNTEIKTQVESVDRKVDDKAVFFEGKVNAVATKVDEHVAKTDTLVTIGTTIQSQTNGAMEQLLAKLAVIQADRDRQDAAIADLKADKETERKAREAFQVMLMEQWRKAEQHER